MIITQNALETEIQSQFWHRLAGIKEGKKYQNFATPQHLFCSETEQMDHKHAYQFIFVNFLQYILLLQQKINIFYHKFFTCVPFLNQHFVSSFLLQLSQRGCLIS